MRGAEVVFDVTTASTSNETSMDDNIVALTLPVIARTASESTITPVERTWMIADGRDTLTLRVTALDPLRVPMPGVSVSLSANVPNVSLSPASAVTDSNGVATFTMTTTESGQAVLTALFDDGAAASLEILRRPSAIQPHANEVNVGVGGTGVLDMTVVNTAVSGDRLTLSVTGLEALDPAWYGFEPSVVPLGSGQFNTARLAVSVPAGQCSVAGTYPITITAAGEVLGIAGQADAAVHITAAPPQLSAVLPEADARVGSDEVLFSWRSNTPGTSTLHVRPLDGEWADYPLTANPIDPTLYTVSVPLEAGTYQWWGEISTECGTTTIGSATAPQSMDVVQSVSFHNREYSFTVSDDYDQTRDVVGMPMLVRVRNDDAAARRVRVSLDNPYSDLIIGFTGNGSIDRAATIQPGQHLDLNLRVFTQEITQQQYGLTLTLRSDDGVTDSVPLTVLVRQPNIDIRMENTVTDPYTLVTTGMLRNYGDTVTDLNLGVFQAGAAPGEGLPANFAIQPDIEHAYMQPGEGIEIRIIPLEITGTTAPISQPRYNPLTGNYLLASAQESSSPPDYFTTMNQVAGPYALHFCLGSFGCAELDVPVTNTCAADRVVTTCTANNQPVEISSQAQHCVNRPNVDVMLRLPFPVRQDTVISDVQVSGEFAPGNPAIPARRAVQMLLNGVAVGDGVVPEQSHLSFPVDASLITAGWQTIGLRAVNLNEAHYTIADNFTLRMNVSYTGSVCAPATANAQLMQSSPYLCDPSGGGGVRVDLGVVKSVSNPLPTLDETVTFTLEVTNHGVADVSGVALTDSLPQGLTYVSDDGSGAYNSETGIWTLGGVPPKK